MVIVGVYGFESSEYTLTLTSTSSAQLLQLGVVVTAAVAQAQTNYYRVLPGRSSSLAPYALRFTVTPFNGHVQLFVSCNNMQPNATSHQWSITPAPGSGSTLEIPSIAAADKGCLANDAQFYAAVYGDSAASYSIQSNIADDPTVPMLVPGLAQSGSVASGAFTYYFVRPGVSYDDIRLLATVLQGDVDLYVSASWDTRPQVGANGAVQSYLLSSVKSGSEDMLLDHHWVQGVCAQRGSCYLIVGVFGAGSASNTFSLQSSYKDSTLQLSSGVPRHSHVDAQHYEYFKFTVSQPELDVIVSVTPLSGDPGELFANMTPCLGSTFLILDDINPLYRPVHQHEACDPPVPHQFHLVPVQVRGGLAHPSVQRDGEALRSAPDGGRWRLRHLHWCVRLDEHHVHHPGDGGRGVPQPGHADRPDASERPRRRRSVRVLQVRHQRSAGIVLGNPAHQHQVHADADRYDKVSPRYLSLRALSMPACRVLSQTTATQTCSF